MSVTYKVSTEGLKFVNLTLGGKNSKFAGLVNGAAGSFKAKFMPNGKFKWVPTQLQLTCNTINNRTTYTHEHT